MSMDVYGTCAACHQYHPIEAMRAYRHLLFCSKGRCWRQRRSIYNVKQVIQRKKVMAA